jgi:hypothetical protein
MPKVHVWFELNSYWRADIELADLRELAREARHESPGDGYFRCPPDEELFSDWTYRPPTGQVPSDALRRRLVEFGRHIENGPRTITEIAMTDADTGGADA